jgi:hypothetical protein
LQGNRYWSIAGPDASLVRTKGIVGCFMEQDVGTGGMEGVHPEDVQGRFDGFLPALHV